MLKHVMAEYGPVPFFRLRQDKFSVPTPSWRGCERMLSLQALYRIPDASPAWMGNGRTLSTYDFPFINSEIWICVKQAVGPSSKHYFLKSSSECVNSAELEAKALG